MNNYLITGASSFLGREFVRQLSQNKKNRVILTSRSKVNFDNYCNSNIVYLDGIDLLIEDDLNRLSDYVKTFFSEAFSIIHCTGYYDGQQEFINTSTSESSKIFESNFVTVYNVVNKLTTLMIEKGGGHNVAFSCNSVKYNYPQMAPFSAAKSALESLFRSVANEYYESKIYCNSFRLATLLTEKETDVKPFGDHNNWLRTEEVVEYVNNFINSSVQIANGNSIELYHYSESFFKDSYFNRIRNNG